MKRVVERLWVVSHKPKGPLVPYLDSFARSLDEQGFKRHLLSRQIRVTANFSKWLEAEEVAAQDVTDEHVQRFFKGPGRRRSIQRGEFATLRRLIDFLLELGVIHPLPNNSEATPIQQAVDTFTTYLRQERGLSDKTLIQ